MLFDIFAGPPLSLLYTMTVLAARPVAFRALTVAPMAASIADTIPLKHRREPVFGSCG